MHFLTTTWFLALMGVVLVWLGWSWGRSQRQRLMTREHSTDAMNPYRDHSMGATADESQAGAGHASHKHHSGCC